MSLCRRAAPSTGESSIRALNEGHLWRILEKPWRPDELCRWVREALAEYEQRRAATAARRAEGRRGAARPVFSPLAKPSPRRLVIHKSAANAGRFRTAGPAPRPTPPAAPKTVAPESVRQIDRRYRDLTDIYSLGVMIHEFLTGELPPSVGAETRPGFLEYRPTAAPELPAPIRAVLEQSFAQEPADRWNNVSEFVRHFRAAAAIAYPAAE